MDFVIGLPMSKDWKGTSYDSILVIVDRLTNMVHYKAVQKDLTAEGLADVIIGCVMRHHGVPDSLVTDQGYLKRKNAGLLLWSIVLPRPTALLALAFTRFAFLSRAKNILRGKRLIRTVFISYSGRFLSPG